MNMQKLGIVSRAVNLCRDTIKSCKFKELNLIRYTLCEVLFLINAQTFKVFQPHFGFCSICGNRPGLMPSPPYTPLE